MGTIHLPTKRSSRIVTDAASIRHGDSHLERLSNETSDTTNAPPHHWAMFNAVASAMSSENRHGPPPGAAERLSDIGSRVVGLIPILDGPHSEGPRGTLERRLPPESAIAANTATSNALPLAHSTNLASPKLPNDDEWRAAAVISSANAPLAASQSWNRSSARRIRRSRG